MRPHWKTSSSLTRSSHHKGGGGEKDKEIDQLKLSEKPEPKEKQTGYRIICITQEKSMLMGRWEGNTLNY